MNSQSSSLNEHHILGTWIGILDTKDLKWTLIFEIEQAPSGKMRAKVGCRELQILDIPTEVKWYKNTLVCKIKRIAATFKGSLNEAEDEIQGIFSQKNDPLPFTLKRKEAAFFSPPLRPQEPKAPYPYKEEHVSYDNPIAGVTLSGTLTLPHSKGSHPTVLLIAGSGPNDRDVNLFGHKFFLVLADHLTKQGIAVLRMDKRGVGKSTGNYDLANTEDFAQDVLAGVKYLKTRKEVNEIGLIGHSEGGIIAPLVAAQSKSVAFIVLMAAPAVKGEDLLYEQNARMSRAMGVDRELIKQEQKFLQQMISIIKQESDCKLAEKKLQKAIAKIAEKSPKDQKKSFVDGWKALAKRLNSTWFRFFIVYNPMTALAKTKIPTLVLHGKLDLQVSPKQNLPIIAQAFKKIGKDNCIIEIPKLNHLFQTCKTGSITEYEKIEETISPLALAYIVDFILDRQPPKK